jgi:hypothetical protein
MINESVLFLTFTDQKQLGFSGKGIYLNCVLDIDDIWHGPMCQVFTNVIRYDTFRGANINGICQANREIIEIAETYHPKYVIYPCIFLGVVTETTLISLRKMGCIVVSYLFDDDVNFESLSKWMAPYIDYFISTGDTRGGIIKAYESIGARCFLGVPLPMNPTIFCKLKDIEKIFDATFVGGMKANRLEYITNIISKGAYVKYLGGGDSQKVQLGNIVKIYNQSRINLNFSSSHENLDTNSRRILNRVFEVTLSGGFLLTEYAPGLENYFEIGREIECFETAQEAAEKIQYYLKHPEEREQIAERGYLRAQREYTGQVQFNKVFREIENDLCKRGRPELIPPKEGSVNPLLQHNADIYYNWVVAIRQSPPPLYDEWLPAAELVLATNPEHKAVQSLLQEARKPREPKPVLIRICVKLYQILVLHLNVAKSGFASLSRIVNKRTKKVF